MAKKGGYTILDFSGYSFTAGTKNTSALVISQITDTYDKPVLVSGLVVGGTAISDKWGNYQRSGLDYIISIPGYSILIQLSGTTVTAANDPLTSPTAPTTNGTYTLKGTKNSSGFTYSWVKDE